MMVMIDEIFLKHNEMTKKQGLYFWGMGDQAFMRNATQRNWLPSTRSKSAMTKQT